MKYADEIIVLSKGVQKYFMETYGRETHFIPNGVNRPEVREAKLITDHFGLEKDSYILFLGRLVPEKGFDIWLRHSRMSSYMADEITEEQYQAEVLDYEEAHRKLNKQLTAIMENTMVWERALSLRNPWIQQMEQYKTPEALDRNFVKKYIEQVVVTFLGDRQAEISLTMKTEE